MTIYFLHGFGGCVDDFYQVTRFLSAKFITKTLVIPGHFKAPSLQEANIDSINKMVDYLANQITQDKPSSIYLCGYSMGGRLSILLSQKLQVNGLILLSSGLGFENKSKAQERKNKDDVWAELLKTEPKKFWRLWYEQPIFATLQKRKDFTQILCDRLQQNNTDLSSVLQFMSPANHKSLQESLTQVHSLLYIAGNRDKKYLAVARKIAKKKIGQIAIVPNVSHSLLLEASETCAHMIENWLLWKRKV